MKTTIFALGCALSLAQAGCAAPTETPKTDAPKTDAPKEKGKQMTFHDFSARDIAGKELKLSDFKGKTVLVVNVASKCGFTRQYAGLEKLYKDNADKNFVILGFPSNDFGGQEPGSDEEIATFCRVDKGVTFPIFSKVKVLGDDAHPLYKWLTSKEENPEFAGAVGWNFTKFLINADGKVVARFASGDAPEGEKIKAALEKEMK